MIAVMAPCFFKPGSVDELIGFFKPIAASASRLPFYYYNMPSITGVSLPVHKFLIEGKKQIPNLVGVKFTHNNLMGDDRIEKQEGADVCDIFHYAGEEYFRKAERGMLETLMASGDDLVVSTGGGLPVWADNMVRMNGAGLTVYRPY